jgi:hypothetical protein
MRLNPRSTIVNPNPRGDEIMAPHDVLMERYIQVCAAMKKLIATVLSDEKDVLFVTVKLKREEFGMVIFIEFVLQEKRHMCCFYVTTLGQSEGAPLEDIIKIVWGMLPLSSCSLYPRTAGFSPVLVLLKVQPVRT